MLVIPECVASVFAKRYGPFELRPRLTAVRVLVPSLIRFRIRVREIASDELDELETMRFDMMMYAIFESWESYFSQWKRGANGRGLAQVGSHYWNVYVKSGYARGMAKGGGKLERRIPRLR